MTHAPATLLPLRFVLPGRRTACIITSQSALFNTRTLAHVFPGAAVANNTSASISSSRRARSDADQATAARSTTHRAKPSSTSLLISHLHARFNDNWSAQTRRNSRKKPSPLLVDCCHPFRITWSSSLARHPQYTQANSAGSAPTLDTASIDNRYSSHISDSSRASRYHKTYKGLPTCRIHPSPMPWTARIAIASQHCSKC